MRQKRERHPIRTLVRLILGLSLCISVLAGGLYFYGRKNLDLAGDDLLFAASRGENVIRVYASGESEPQELFLTDGQKTWVDFDLVSEKLKVGFLDVEDRTFYSHHGVNIGRTMRAAVNSVIHTAPTFGASTITQQVVKNVSGDNEVTVKRKFNEILRALYMERAHSKDEIFEMYLNIVPMGDRVEGVAAASHRYFGKDPADLSWAEAATLIGIANAPSRYHPIRHPDACLEKRNSVLKTVYAEGHITEEEYLAASGAPLGVIEGEDGEERGVLSWFEETLLSDLEEDLIAERGMSLSAARLLLSGGGLRVYSTEDRDIQSILEEAMADPTILPDEVANGLEVAMCVCDSSTGDLVAVVGRAGEKTANRLYSHATGPHTPGSVLKPLALYAPLVDRGAINWATVFDDVPVSFEGETPYPLNADRRYDGLTTVCGALSQSKNTVAVRLLSRLGKKEAYRILSEDYEFPLVRGETGSDGRTYTDLDTSPLALGQLTYGVSLRDLTRSYTVFPRDGVTGRGRTYLYVTDAMGNVVLDKRENDGRRVMKPETARILCAMLGRVTEVGTARKLTIGELVDVAGKTGTSGECRDRLFLGFTPYYTAGIWCGYDDGRSVGRMTRDHLSVWDTVMWRIHLKKMKTGEDRTFSTEGLVKRAFCLDSGELPCEACTLDPRGERISYGYFTRDNAPKAECAVHIPVPYDSLTGGVVIGNCPDEDRATVSLIRVERRFPIQVVVTDAEYVYRPLGSAPPGDSFDVPFFIHALMPGEYAGIGREEKQFNAACYLHSDE